MGRIFVSESTGATIYVFAEDHCPPHVHARHRGEGWIARAGFCFAGGAVTLISIAPLRNAPQPRAVNALLRDIGARLVDCRRRWWTTMRTTCLANQWAVLSSATTIALCPAHRADAKQILDASYDPATGRLQVRFRDRTATEGGMNS